MPENRPLSPLPLPVRRSVPSERSPVLGRPPKYKEPSRPVTLTLPESTLNNLKRIDPDRSRAIVKLTEEALHQSQQPAFSEIIKVAPETGLLIVGPCKALATIPFLRLIEVAPGRFLLALEQGHDFRSLELSLLDVVETIPTEEFQEHRLILDLIDHIKKLRQSESVRMGEILFVRI